MLPGLLDPEHKQPLPGPEVTPLPAVAFASLPPDAVRVLAAGDIAQCHSRGTAATGALVASDPAATVLVLGDNAYWSGSDAEYRDCYDPAWGPAKDRTWPVPGNHDYATSGAAGYFAYFGERAGDPAASWRAVDVGAWRVYLLDSECGQTAGCAMDDQVAWLREDLAAHPDACLLATWHRPRYSSGPHGSNRSVQPLWEAFADAGGDVVLNGHDHLYERFAPLDATGEPAGGGIREFVVGTGGAQLYRFGTPLPASEARAETTFGVLELVLRPDGYDWSFRGALGSPYQDAGSGPC